MPYKTDESGTWRVPLTHYDRSRNPFGISLDDFELACEIAKNREDMAEALRHVKVLLVLLDDGKMRPDSKCYPSLIRRSDGSLVK